MHPSDALFQGGHRPASIAVCDHYAGPEKPMRKSVAHQQQLGPVFDITLDAEDDAATGNEASHAQLIASIINRPDNRLGTIGARIHHCGHPFSEQDIALFCQGTADARHAIAPIIEAASNTRWGPIQHNDVLHDRASNRYCWMILKRKIQRHGNRGPANTR